MLSRDWKNDAMLDLCKQQGYVPQGCRLDGKLIFALVSEGKDSCDGCNHDRTICAGRMSKECVSMINQK